MCSFEQFVLDQFNNPPIDIFSSVTTLIGVRGVNQIGIFMAWSTLTIYIINM